MAVRVDGGEQNRGDEMRHLCELTTFIQDESAPFRSLADDDDM